MDDDLLFETYLSLIECGILPEPEFVEMYDGTLTDLHDLPSMEIPYAC